MHRKVVPDEIGCPIHLLSVPQVAFDQSGPNAACHRCRSEDATRPEDRKLRKLAHDGGICANVVDWTMPTVSCTSRTKSDAQTANSLLGAVLRFQA